METNDPVKIPDIVLLPLNPLPRHLAPYLLPHSPLTTSQKEDLFTSVYLNAASTGQSDVLEFLLSIPDAPQAYSSALGIRRTRGIEAMEENATSTQDTLSDLAPKKWVDLEALDSDGRPALISAVALRHTECVGILVEGGVEIDAQDKGA